MLQCADIKSGYIILRNYIPKEKIDPLIKGTSLEKFEFIADDPTFLKNNYCRSSKTKNPPEYSAGQQPVGTVPFEHAFNVKGVASSYWE